MPLTRPPARSRSTSGSTPTVGGNGGGGPGNGGADNAVDRHLDRSPGARLATTRTRRPTPPTATTPQPVFLALRADRPFRPRAAASSARPATGSPSSTRRTRLAPTYDRAPTATSCRPRRSTSRAGGASRLALGFGTTQAGAVATAGGAARTPLRRRCAAQIRGRLVPHTTTALNTAGRTSPGCRRPSRRPRDSTYYVSANVLKASEDKTFPGAIVGLAGQPVGPGGLRRRPRQHLLRLLPRGLRPRPLRGVDRARRRRRPGTASAAVRFLFDKQQLPDGSMPRNSLVNGKPAPDSLQHPAGRGRLPDPHGPHVGLTGDALYARTSGGGGLLGRARAVVRLGALGGAERILAVDHRGRDRRAGRGRGDRPADGDPAGARVYRATADQYQRNIKGWTVTTNGSL